MYTNNSRRRRQLEVLEVDVYGTSVLILMASEPLLSSEMPDIFFLPLLPTKVADVVCPFPKPVIWPLYCATLLNCLVKGLWLSEKHGTRLNSVKNPF